MIANESIYDISQIPYFAYSPGPWIWLAAFAFIALLFAFYLIRERSKSSSRERYSAYQILVRALKNLPVGPDAQLNADQVDRVAVLLRRYLALLLTPQIVSMTEGELRTTLCSLSNEDARALIAILIEIEARRFDPGAPAVESQQIASILDCLRKLHSTKSQGADSHA